MTDEENRYWVGRCLMLELTIAELKGYQVAPPLPEIERRSLYPAEDANHPPPCARQICHNATAGDIAYMRELRRRGLTYNEISRRTPFSEYTARRYTKDILIEREVHAT